MTNLNGYWLSNQAETLALYEKLCQKYDPSELSKPVCSRCKATTEYVAVKTTETRGDLKVALRLMRYELNGWKYIVFSTCFRCNASLEGHICATRWPDDINKEIKRIKDKALLTDSEKTEYIEIFKKSYDKSYNSAQAEKQDTGAERYKMRE